MRRDRRERRRAGEWSISTRRTGEDVGGDREGEVWRCEEIEERGR